MFSFIQRLRDRFFQAVTVPNNNIDLLPPEWVKDDVLRNAVSKGAKKGSEFYRQIETLYACIDEYNERTDAFKQIHLLLRKETSDFFARKGHALGDNLGAHFEGFGFLSRGKIYDAYYIDNFEDVGFRVFDDKKTYAYFRTYAGNPATFGKFVEQVIFQREQNPQLHF